MAILNEFIDKDASKSKMKQKWERKKELQRKKKKINKGGLTST